MKTAIEHLESRLSEREFALDDQSKRVAYAAKELNEISHVYESIRETIDDLKAAIAKLKA